MQRHNKTAPEIRRHRVRQTRHTEVKWTTLLIFVELGIQSLRWQWQWHQSPGRVGVVGKRWGEGQPTTKYKGPPPPNEIFALNVNILQVHITRRFYYYIFYIASQQFLKFFLWLHQLLHHNHHCPLPPPFNSTIQYTYIIDQLGNDKLF